MRAVTCSAVLALALTPPAFAQSQFQKYQQMTAEGSPVELFELVGEDRGRSRRDPTTSPSRSATWARAPGC
jgi:hypothetical protein